VEMIMSSNTFYPSVMRVAPPLRKEGEGVVVLEGYGRSILQVVGSIV
jgi:hypothetical protein